MGSSSKAVASNDTATQFAVFFGVIGALTGCSMVAETGDAPGMAYLVVSVLGYALGHFVGQVVWRVILVALFLLFTWLRMEACAAFREGWESASLDNLVDATAATLSLLSRIV